MSQRNLLLLSSSRYRDYGALEFGEEIIRDFLGECDKVLYIPYAVVTEERNKFLASVQQRFEELGHELVSIEEFDDPVSALDDFAAVAVNGGNTFELLRRVQHDRLLEPVRKRVAAGMHYLGWSAGSNLACPTLCTTNDMPIVKPESFEALGLVPFQINAHFTDAVPPGHRGETRRMRIEEFLLTNPETTVVGLPEGDMLRVHGDTITLHGEQPVVVFRAGREPAEYAPGEDLSFLLN